jgi:hypothetical protein
MCNRGAKDSVLIVLDLAEPDMKVPARLGG